MVRNNSAYNNAGFGISAGESGSPAEPARTNIDGGGNKASGNGELEQCVGVVCDPSERAAARAHRHDRARDDDHHGAGRRDAAARRRPSRSPPPTCATTAPGHADRRDGTECRLDPPPDLSRSRSSPRIPSRRTPGDPPDIIEPPEGEGWAECVSPVHYHGLELGEHHFEVRAIDNNPDRTRT